MNAPARRRGPALPLRNLPSVDPEIPQPGFYLTRMSKGGPPVAVRIWLGPSIDPATGEEVQERGFRWQCTVNGERVPYQNFWPSCACDPIAQPEYDRILAESATMDPTSPFFDPRKPIDRLTMKMPF